MGLLPRPSLGFTGGVPLLILANAAAPVTARKDDAPAAIQAAIVNVAVLDSICGGGGLIQTTSG